MRRYIEEAWRGDRQAFERVVRHFTPMALAVAYEKLHDYQLAEDAVQEAFTEAFLNLNKLREVEAFPGWFKAIVTRQCYRTLRKKQQPAVSYDEAAEAIESTFCVADIIESKETRRLIHESIATLTSNMRIAVQLYYFQGYSLQEISEFLGASVPVLKKRLFDARRKLKGALPVADVVSMFNQLYEGGRGMLHIVNGNVVGDKLRQGIVQGDVLVWREVYPHGPVFLDPAEEDNRLVRAQYLKQSMGIPQKEFIESSERQEKILADYRKYDEVVLWFEHDLFDQTMLCYFLHYFSKEKKSSTKLSLLCIGDYPGVELFQGLGQLSVEQLGTLSGTWKLIGDKELEMGQAFWKAYTSQSPEPLQQLLTQDTSILPYAHSAFQAHLSRFPSMDNGLGVVEQATLEVIHEGIQAPYELFSKVGAKLHGLGMGDLQYWHIVRQMVQEPYPLIKMCGLKELPRYNDSLMQFTDCELVLTELGKKVILGQEDWTEKKGIEEWYGGVHLQGAAPRWRWNPLARSIHELRKV